MINSIYMTGLALILLIPFIYFLPLGFTKVGKWTLIILSFLMAIIALTANTIFSIWQTSGILLLLAFLFTYLITNRYGSVIFVNDFDTEKEADDYIVIQSMDGDLNTINKPLISNPEQKPSIHQIRLNPEVTENLEVQLEDEIFEMDINEKVGNIEKVDRHSHDMDDEQLEDFFENRLTFIQDIDEKLVIDQQRDLEDENGVKRLSESRHIVIDSNETPVRDNLLSDEDYIIQEINFERKDGKSDWRK